MIKQTLAIRSTDMVRQAPALKPVAMFLQAVLFWIPGALVFFRVTLLSGLDTIVGNKGDSRLVVVLHEHWLDVLRGRAAWRSPTFFYPVHGVLGYADTFLLDEIFYLPMRAIGLDPFAAFQTTLIWLSLVGFVSMFALCRTSFTIAVIPSAFISTLFAFANNLYVGGGHPQLFAVYWLPLLLLFAVRSWRAPTNASATGWGVACGVLFGLLLFSTFYVGWFALLACGIVGTFAVLLHIEQFGSRSTIAILRNRARPIVGLLLGLFTALVPFALVYLPTLREFGGRSYKDAMHYAPSPAEVFNVGGDNVVWGGLLGRMLSASSIRNVETSLAVTPLVLVSVIVVGAIAFRRRRTHEPQTLAPLTLAVACSVVVLVILPVRLPFGSPWRIPWTLVPGASAIRAIDRLQIVTQFLACCVFGLGISIQTDVDSA